MFHFQIASELWVAGTSSAVLCFKIKTVSPAFASLSWKLSSLSMSSFDAGEEIKCSASARTAFVRWKNDMRLYSEPPGPPNTAITQLSPPVFLSLVGKCLSTRCIMSYKIKFGMHIKVYHVYLKFVMCIRSLPCVSLACISEVWHVYLNFSINILKVLHIYLKFGMCP